MTLAQIIRLEAMIAKVGIPEVKNSRNLAHLETPDRDFFASAVNNDVGTILALLWNAAPEMLALHRAHLTLPDAPVS